MGHSSFDQLERPAWNIARKVGAKPPKPKEIWAIRFFLDQDKRIRDRALFDLSIDSKLRGCDLVRIRIGDLVVGGPTVGLGVSSIFRFILPALRTPF
jgi:hypothetical protein